MSRKRCRGSTLHCMRHNWMRSCWYQSRSRRGGLHCSPPTRRHRKRTRQRKVHTPRRSVSVQSDTAACLNWTSQPIRSRSTQNHPSLRRLEARPQRTRSRQKRRLRTTLRTWHNGTSSCSCHPLRRRYRPKPRRRFFIKFHEQCSSLDRCLRTKSSCALSTVSRFEGRNMPNVRQAIKWFLFPHGRSPKGPRAPT